MRYYIGFLIAIGLSIIVILLLFVGGGGTSKKAVVPKTLYSYADTDAVVSLTIDGPINADSVHDSIRMSVSNTQAVIQEYQGYQGTLIKTQTYANNTAAYYAFLRALSIAGFTLGDTSPALDNDTGYCATGTRSDYRITEDGNSLEHFWATNCGTATYKGNTAATLNLFEAQFPDYATFTQTVDF